MTQIGLLTNLTFVLAIKSYLLGNSLLQITFPSDFTFASNASNIVIHGIQNMNGAILPYVYNNNYQFTVAQATASNLQLAQATLVFEMLNV